MILLINYSHKWWYKALSVLLVVALILAISFGAAPRAHAVGVLTITVCAAILAVMAGAGIATVVSGMNSADIQNWMTGKLNEWDTYRNDGNVFTDLIQNNLITTTVKGALAIGNAAARGISDFITWLKSDLSLQDNTTTSVYSVSGSINLPIYNGLNGASGKLFIFDNNQWKDYVSASTNNVYAVDINGGIYYLSSSSFILYNFRDYKSSQSVDSNNSYNSTLTSGGFYLYIYEGSSYSKVDLPYYNTLNEAIADYGNMIQQQDSSLNLDSDVINIPSVADDGQTDIVIGIDGVYPGATTDEAADVIMDGVLDNTLDTTMTITDEYVDAVEAVVINEQPISVNTDHHMIGFTNLPDFVNLNLNSIWHYVSDAVEYASGFISWFVNLLSSVPTLAIPLYMSFTLLIVLSFIRRILL